MPTIKLLRAPSIEIEVPDIDDTEVLEDLARVEFQVQGPAYGLWLTITFRTIASLLAEPCILPRVA
jgi:hypothetical protein